MQYYFIYRANIQVHTPEYMSKYWHYVKMKVIGQYLADFCQIIAILYCIYNNIAVAFITTFR